MPDSRPFKSARVAVALALLCAGSVQAAAPTVTIEIPRLSVAEYHRPYTAIWLEDGAQRFVANLAVWYDVKQPNKKGNEWLKDMRQWWRKSGRTLDMPVDGISGATRPPGEHRLAFDGNAAPWKDLAPGEYRLVVEAAREVGGRELIAVPFRWPVEAPQRLEASGEHELGKIVLEFTP
ncbi:MAG: DUF2271 domain-containing protein [Pseudomonadota bacterium]|nr:MAG: DUF2271 domain-containing protein [Pseudomonadota bacterium]